MKLSPLILLVALTAVQADDNVASLLKAADAYRTGQDDLQVETHVTAAQRCLHLSLMASRKGVTCQRIELWIGKARHEPVQADLFVQSYKLAKQARFVFDKPSAPAAVTEMVLLDRLSNHKETRVRYVSRQARTVPEAWLNPMFLARNPALD
jgi:hypothetical protein